MNADARPPQSHQQPDLMDVAWSPDGTQIVFTRMFEIYVMNADGSNPRNLTNNPADDSFPMWSPDGEQIAFMSKRDGNDEIYIMNADGSDVRRLTQHEARDYSPVLQALLPSSP
jgi:TolB protein